MSKAKQQTSLSLPEGVSIIERTKEIELSGRGREKYFPIVEGLKRLGPTECMKIDINGLGQKQIDSYKWGIRSIAKQMGIDKTVRVAEKSGMLYLWI